LTILARMTAEVHEEVPVLKVEGEIDAANASEFASELRALVSNASFAIVADIAGVTYFDSAGLNALAVIQSELDRRQQHLHVVAPPGTRGHRLLAITNLDRVLTVHEDLDHALKAARGHI
jgi:anti-anti-sigma factor